MSCHFLSDNASGIDPAVLNAISEANRGHAPAYGHDAQTAAAEELFKQHFGAEVESLIMLTGTGANVLALQSVLQSFEAVICAQSAHLYKDECGAPEKFIGSKLLPADSTQGKLTPQTIAPLLRDSVMVHRARPRVVSIAQCTEWGTVYTPDELRALAEFCRQQGLLLHMDGARLCNAAAALELPLRAVSTDCGVDLLSFGGTKNGLMGAEAVVFGNPALAANAGYYRKQAMQLVSKMRFVAAQWIALLETDLWRQNASHSNRMARLLADRLQGRVEIVMPVEANVVFARLQPHQIERLQAEFTFAVWDSGQSIVRWMTAFDTTEEDVEYFASKIDECVNAD